MCAYPVHSLASVMLPELFRKYLIFWTEIWSFIYDRIVWKKISKNTSVLKTIFCQKGKCFGIRKPVLANFVILYA